MTEQLMTYTPRGNAALATPSGLEFAQRAAKLLANSDLVPAHFKGRIDNCVLALEMAQRLNASPLAVMQSLYIVHGRPAWSSQFLIAMVNACGRFQPLQFEMDGTGDDYGCTATARLTDGSDTVRGPKVTLGMAKAEGWFGKAGSKWQTMPELMLRYRSATFFARLYAPDLTLGIQTQDEVIDVVAEPVGSRRPLFKPAAPGPDVVEVPLPQEVGELPEPEPLGGFAQPAAPPETPEEVRHRERLACLRRAEDAMKPYNVNLVDAIPAMVAKRILKEGSTIAKVFQAPLPVLQKIEAAAEELAQMTKDAKEGSDNDQ